MELDYETESVTLSGYPYPVCGIIMDFQRGNRTIEDCASSNMVWGFIKVIGIASVIAIPAGYIVIQNWLDGYTYRIDNYWWIYAVALMFIVLVAIVTITWQAVRLMNSDPINELKKE